jgi:hypothetical protein
MPSQVNRRAVAARVLLFVIAVPGYLALPSAADATCYKAQNQRGCCLGHQCASCSRALYPNDPGCTYDYRVQFDYPWSMAASQPPMHEAGEQQFDEARKAESKRIAQKKTVKIISPIR